MQNINTNDKIKGKVHKIHAPPPPKKMRTLLRMQKAETSFPYWTVLAVKNFFSLYHL